MVATLCSGRERGPSVGAYERDRMQPHKVPIRRTEIQVSQVLRQVDYRLFRWVVTSTLCLGSYELVMPAQERWLAAAAAARSINTAGIAQTVRSSLRDIQSRHVVP